MAHPIQFLSEALQRLVIHEYSVHCTRLIGTQSQSLSFCIFSPAFSMSVPKPCIVLQPMVAVVTQITNPNNPMLFNFLSLLILIFMIIINQSKPIQNREISKSCSPRSVR